MTGGRDPYAIATRIAQLQHRARRRYLTNSVATGIALVAVMALLADVSLGEVLVVVIVLVVVVAARALRDRHGTVPQFGPVSGLPLTQRRRVLLGIRRARLDDDHLLHEVQLVEVARLHDKGNQYWLCVFVAAVYAALAITADGWLRVAGVLLAVYWAGYAGYLFVHLRGAKRILAQAQVT